jgi:hypothetical protein
MVVVVLVPELPQPVRLRVVTANKNIKQNLYRESIGAKAPEA